MWEDGKLTRRDVLRRGLAMGTVALGAGWFGAACGDDSADPEFSCQDTSGLSEYEKKKRANLNYTDRSPHPDKTCANCRFFVSTGQEGPCGGCTLVDGPIHPAGYCDSWAPPEEGGSTEG
jgi:hypothetical protein